MTQVADDVKLGKISRQWNDLFRRVREGALDADGVSAALQDVIEGRFGENFFTETGELKIQIPAFPRPTLSELQKKFSWIKSVERDNSPTETVMLRLNTVLSDTERRLNGVEYERRIAPRTNIILGYQQAIWLVEHQNEFPMLMALLGKVYIDFLSLVAVDAYGYWCYPSLDRDGERWILHWHWLDYSFNRSGRLAVSSK